MMSTYYLNLTRNLPAMNSVNSSADFMVRKLLEKIQLSIFFHLNLLNFSFGNQSTYDV